MRLAGTIIAAISVLLVASPASSGLLAAETAVSAAMVGHWEGSARIIVSWCQQQNLRVSVDIATDGTVTGNVGDATLTKGRLKRNRGRLGRKLNTRTGYIITGGLDGSIVVAEGIKRSSVKLPLNFRGGTFAGGLHTSGAMFGGKARMIPSASSLTLVRRNTP